MAHRSSNVGPQGEWIPVEGEWPVDPQQDVDIDKGRIWVDGCFDFSHHGTRAAPTVVPFRVQSP